MTAYVPGITETDLKKIVLALQQLAAGRSNAVGTVTLATGSATTVVTTANCAAGSTPMLTPATANAAAEARQRHDVCERRHQRLVHDHACQFRDGGTNVSLRDPRLSWFASTRNQVHEFWSHVEPLLRRAVTRTGISAFCNVEREILCGDALLWLAVEGEGSRLAILAAVSTSLQRTDAGKVCVITACAGKDMPRWLSLIEHIEKFARNEGCHCVRIYGRRGWLRALDGYEQIHVILDKELD